MTVLGEMKGKEKLAWILILFGLLGIELTSISVERTVHEQEQQEARAEQLKHFDDISGGIHKSIDSSNRQFVATMDKSNRIIGGVKDNLNAVTGGSSFAEFGVAPNMGFGNPPTFPLFVDVYGKYPMRSVAAQIQRIEEGRDPENIKRQIQSMHAIPLGDGTILPGPHPIDERLSPGKYGIGIWSVSGISNETLDLWLNSKGELMQSYEVSKDGKIMVRVKDGKLMFRRGKR